MPAEPIEYKFNEIFKHVTDAVNTHTPNVRLATAFCDKLQYRKREICEAYLNLRNAVKNRYMKVPSEPLDRHKCAAAFMIALTNKFDIEENGSNKEKFAVFVGMLLLKIFIRMECKEIGDMGLIDLITENKGLKFPPCVCDKQNDYLHNWLTEMYCARHEDKMFVLSVSNNLFMIETYNRQLAKIKTLEAAQNL